MATFDLSMQTVEQAVNENPILLIDFWAEWCAPCKTFGPVFDKASENHSDIAFAKVDTDKEQDLAQAFGIQSIPTLVVFREGIPVFSQPGALPETALEELIGKVRELDMDDVRQKVAEAEAAAAQG